MKFGHHMRGLGAMMLKVFLMTAFVVPPVALGQKAKELPPSPSPPKLEVRMLVASKTVDLGIPYFGFVNQPLCDAHGGTIYDISSIAGMRGPFLGVAADGRTHIRYALPDELGAQGRVNAAVSPSGKFFLLHWNFKEHKLLSFKDDGTLNRISKVDIPSGIAVQHIAIADSGVIFVQGSKDNAKERDKPDGQFAALFDGSGQMIRDLREVFAGDNPRPEAPKDPSPKRVAPSLPEGAAVASADGRFYVLEPSEVVVIGQSGEVEQRLHFDKPDPSMLATRLDAVAGAVSVGLDTVKPSGEIDPEFLILDPQTGETRGRYAFDPGLTGSVVCFNDQREYILLGLPKTNATVDIVPVK